MVIIADKMLRCNDSTWTNRLRLRLNSVIWFDKVRDFETFFSNTCSLVLCLPQSVFVRSSWTRFPQYRAELIAGICHCDFRQRLCLSASTSPSHGCSYLRRKYSPRSKTLAELLTLTHQPLQQLRILVFTRHIDPKASCPPATAQAYPIHASPNHPARNLTRVCHGRTRSEPYHPHSRPDQRGVRSWHSSCMQAAARLSGSITAILTLRY